MVIDFEHHYIPIELGRKQVANFKAPIDFVTIPGADHNDISFRNQEAYWGNIKRFIATQIGL